MAGNSPCRPGPASALTDESVVRPIATVSDSGAAPNPATTRATSPGASGVAATLQVDRPAASAGEGIVVSGSGFVPQADLAIAAGDDSKPLAVVRTDDQGQFQQSVAVPSDLPYGQQPFTITDAAG